MNEFLSDVRTVLRRTGMFQRLKASAVYDLYWRFSDRTRLEQREGQVAFYRSVLTGLSDNPLIFDIGANRGDKTDIFLRLGARVVAVDPDPVNQAVLQSKFRQYRLRPKPVHIVAAAASDSIGTATMWADQPGSALNSLSAKWVQSLARDDRRFGRKVEFGSSQQVPTTTLEQLMRTYGMPFFVKIDVEGHEISVLRGLKRPIPYLSFEVNLPEFRPEAEECIALLDELVPSAEFNYAADCGSSLALGNWLPLDSFMRAFRAVSDTSLEIFWRDMAVAGSFGTDAAQSKLTPRKSLRNRS